ncbi:hypothetical protein COCON_G00194580 [Conger conger]|uniref:Cadherin domain-containing protein n=1 Tax=Conger conger TaxID=82655 RepID=A0A9Q1D173_CONCO|nr:hypothetical protein COCON_G00194580 [Conger conger]
MITFMISGLDLYFIIWIFAYHMCSFIVLPLSQNDTAEIHVPRNVGVGHIVTTVRAVDNDYGESGRLTYEISDGNDEHLFEMHSVTGEIRTAHPSWEEVAPVVELIIKVTDHGKPTLSAAAKLIIKAYSGPLPEGEPRITEEQRRWDVSLPLIVTLSIISIMLLAAMVTIAVKCKRENKRSGLTTAGSLSTHTRR